MPHPPRLSYLFDRYLSGTCSPEEVEEFVLLLKREGTDEYLNDQLRSLWSQSGDEAGEAPVDWERMYAEVTGGVRRRPVARWVAGLAAVAVLAAGGWWWTRQKEQPVANRVAAARKPVAVLKKKTIHLPDGSSVVLNTSSRLDYTKPREVTLIGEGYFDIQKAPGQPFLVHTGKLTTRVLGTTFNIRAYPGDKSIQITVTRGRVQVLTANGSLGTLRANQQIEYILGTEKARQQTVDPEPVVAWKPQEIFYDNKSMEEVAKDLEKRYNVTLSFTNPAIKECRVTATFSTEDALEEVLQVLCAVTQDTYTINGSSITLNGQGCN